MRSRAALDGERGHESACGIAKISPFSGECSCPHCVKAACRSACPSAVNPDEFRLFKPTLLSGSRPIIGRRIGSKEFKLVYDSGGSRMVKNVPVPQPDRDKLTLTDDEVLTLARWACPIEAHYSEICGQAPSDYPEFAAFLVEQGIDSLSLNPDAVLKTYGLLAKIEQAPRLATAAATV